MADALLAIEQFGLVRALKASFVAYPVVNALHILCIGVLLTSVLLMDVRLLGGLRTLPAAPFVMTLRRFALAAFAGAAITGALLFSVRASEYATQPVFLVKLGLILLAGLNFLAFQGVSGDAEQPGGTAKALAVLSLLLWTGVLFAGRFIGFL